MSPDRGAQETADQSGFASGEVDSKAVREAVGAVKPPPTESKGSIWSRRWIVLCFWLIVSLLGYPIWMKTTTVYRANLPYDSMYHWDSGNACNPVFPLSINIEAPQFPDSQVQDLVQSIQKSLDSENGFPSHTLRVQTSARATQASSSSEDTALTVILHSNSELQVPEVVIRPHSTFLDLSIDPGMLSEPSRLGTFIGQELANTFLHEHATIGHMISSSPGSHPEAKSLSPEFTALLEERKTRAMKYSSNYHLTFTLLTPSAFPSDWDIEAAIQTVIKPLTRGLSSVSTFTIDTQVQPYATFSASVHPRHDQDKGAWLLDQAQLGSFINAAEWPISPSIGEATTINFLLYVPAPEQTPLYIAPSADADPNALSAHSWLIPQWGSVYILNRPQAQVGSSSLTASELQEPLLAFSSHLLALLGLPDEPSQSLPLRLAALKRTLTLSLLHSSASTMGALARLTQSLPSISIPRPAAASVALTLDSLEQTCAALQRGRFAEALARARAAERAAEKAFFDPSMVGQVYFPDEHKVAVYLPLLGPVAVPLVLALLKEVKDGAAWLKSRRR